MMEGSDVLITSNDWKTEQIIWDNSSRMLDNLLDSKLLEEETNKLYDYSA